MVLALAHTLQRVQYICAPCAKNQQLFRRGFYKVLDQRRSITQNYIRKTGEAAEAWELQAREIKAGRKQSFLSFLEERGFVNSVAGNRDDLDQLITNKRIGAYVGIDPTAPSLHVGHLIPLMALFWMYVHGMKAVSLLGGATARVGDPTNRTTAREEIQASIRRANMANTHIQLKKLWQNVELHVKKYDYQWEWAWRRELANNNAWLNKLPAAELLRVLGTGVKIGTMLGRETVRTRMASKDGLSLGEFLYPVLQAWDWWHMYSTKGVQVQIGGSDQFGNIVAGIDAIKYINKNHYDPLERQMPKDLDNILNAPMGFTVPLLTTSSGEKFGKTAGNAVWLDKDMTSTFDLYQFFVRTSDADVGRYLRLFTFLPTPHIEKIVAEHMSSPEKRIAQHKLAYEVLEIVHGKNEAHRAAEQHRLLFPGSAANTPLKVEPIFNPDNTSSSNTDINRILNKEAPFISAENTPPPHLTLPISLVMNTSIANVLHAAGMTSSRSEATRLIIKGGAYIGSRPGNSGTMGDQLDYTPIKNWDTKQTRKHIIDDSLLILRVGKWKVKLVRLVSDEEFERLGLSYPGKEEESSPGTGGEKKEEKQNNNIVNEKSLLWKTPLASRGLDL